MLKPTEISRIIQDRIEKFDNQASNQNQGTILSIKDGIVKVYGLSNAMSGEMIELADHTYGMVFNLDRDVIDIVVLGSYQNLSEGQIVRCTGRVLSVPVGESLLGRIVNALGEPIDDQGEITAAAFSPIEKVAPGVITRKSVTTPLQTGIKAIDAMVPIGRGQRELIIGDRQTGKTAIAIDAIINQKNTGVKCIYVAIGQKTSAIANIVTKLQEHDVLKNTIIVAATAADSAAEQYIAAYSGCAMGEYFRDRGEDALIVYDDLTKHAWAYRQISLLLKRPPGREAYPGDIFYLHSRLLERAAQVNEHYVTKMTNGEITNKSGSLTALPIVETQFGDVSAFIPTNIISITDGQIFLKTDLFNAGIRPAIDAGLSVSRVGSAAQTHIIKKLGGSLRLALAQYRELEDFAQFSSELDEATRKQLEHGQRAIEMLKQTRFCPMNIAQMAISLFLIDKQLLTDVSLHKVVDFETQIHQYFYEHHQDVMNEMLEQLTYSPALEQKLQAIILEYKQDFLQII